MVFDKEVEDAMEMKKNVVGFQIPSRVVHD